MITQPATLPEALARAAGGPGQITCLRADGSSVTWSYRDLCQEAERVLAGLRQLGLRPGDPVILHLEDIAGYLAAFWACVLGGFIAAPLIPARGSAARLRAARELCGHPPVITGPAAAEPGPGGGASWHISDEDDVFTLLFTSGSTGVPKAATLTHRNVLTMIRGYIELEGLDARETSFNWMPLDHAGGLLAFHLRDVYLGCHQIHASPAAVLADPLSWLDWLDHFAATCTWAPNFAFSLINDQLISREDKRGWDLSRLRHIMTAGEMIVPATVRRFLAMLGRHGLPPDALHPSWGMSETSGGVTFSSAFRLTPAIGEGRFTDVGRPIPGAALRIVDDRQNPLPDGQPGRIQVTGPTVTSGYFRNPAANEAAFTADGWFDTGDIGLLTEGRLTMTGRAKDIIIVNGLNYYYHEIEAAAEEVPGVVVTCTAACAVRPNGDTDGDTEDTDALAIFYCTELRQVKEMTEQWDAIRRHVTAVIGISPRYLLPVGAEAIPRTETGKIRRAKLRQLFDQGAFDHARARADEFAAAASRPAGPAANPPRQDGKEERVLIGIWQCVLGTGDINIHDDFFDLGGDSLASMRIVSMARGAGLEFTPDDVTASRSIAELAALIRAGI